VTISNEIVTERGLDVYMLSTYTTQTYIRIRSQVGSYEVNFKSYK